jgi:toxin ParE1/3/4
MKFHIEAEREIEDAVDYYERQRIDLGRDVRIKMEEAAARIRRNPKLFSHFRNTDFRKCFVERFPYTIFFRELDDGIWVAAVAHQKRREGYWLDRTPEDG